MSDNKKSNEQLLIELDALKKKLADLDSLEKDKQLLELELQKSKELTDMIVNNIPYQIFWKSRDLSYLGCNQAFAEVTGMGSPSEVAGKTDYDFHRDSTHAESYRAWDKKIMDRGEAVLNIEESYHDSNGNEGTVLTSKVPLKDKTGQVFGLIGICLDITDRKSAEHALRESAERARLQRTAITELTLGENLIDIDSKQSLEKICNILSKTINVARTSVWKLSSDGLELRCLKLYESDKNTYTHGTVLDAKQIPNYFNSIKAESRIYVEDAFRDPRTIELAEDYLKPLGITSMLDAGILIDGQLVGVVCCEHIGRKRNWHSDEEAFVSTVASFVAQLMVVSDRRRAEKALKESESKFKALAEYSIDTIMRFDKQHRHLYVNPIVESHIGIKPECFIGKTHAEMGFPDDLVNLWESAIDKVFKAGKPNRTEFHLPNDIWFDWMLTPEFSEDGEVGAVITSARDITDRKRAEQQLKAILEANPDPVVVYDKKGHPQFVSSAFTDLFGWTKDELTGRLIPYVPDDQQEITRATIEKLYQTGESVQMQTKRITKKGDTLDVLLSAAIIKDTEDKSSGMVVNLTDLTHILKLEYQLQQTQKMDSLGTLAGGIAHDFNNILSAIIGYTELASDDAQVGVTTQRYIKEILKAGMRARQLVTQILTFSRKVEPNLKPVDLNKVIEQTEAMLERTIPKMINIEHLLAKDLWLVNADSNQLFQVIMNLATNAKDAMPDGGKLIFETKNIDLELKDSHHHTRLTPGNYVLLTISDTGHGMDRTTRSHIFEPFFTKKEVGKGTGLGLSTVYGIVEKHGGHVTCDSEVGHGATFKIFLKAIQPTKDNRKENKEDHMIFRGNETILLVDDEDAIRDFCRQILEYEGYNVILAETGEKALEIYQQESTRIDLIILDLNMPGMGGHKTFNALKELNSDVKVVIASGYSEEGQLKDKLKSGVKGFAQKPFLRAEMSKTVRKALDS